MIFEELIKTQFYATNISLDPSSISVYPVSQFNLEGIKILIDTCKRMGSENNNVTIATIDPYIWIGGVLDKHWDKISFVTSKPIFDILKIEYDKIISKRYNVITIDIENDDNLDEFFNNSKFKTLVLFSIIKIVDLISLKSNYIVRYSDITEKYEVRNKKIDDILK